MDFQGSFTFNERFGNQLGKDWYQWYSDQHIRLVAHHSSSSLNIFQSKQNGSIHPSPSILSFCRRCFTSKLFMVTVDELIPFYLLSKWSYKQQHISLFLCCGRNRWNIFVWYAFGEQKVFSWTKTKWKRDALKTHAIKSYLCGNSCIHGSIIHVILRFLYHPCATTFLREHNLSLIATLSVFGRNMWSSTKEDMV